MVKLFKWSKDGGPKSFVSGLFLVESKKWFSVAVLRFSAGSRDAYHSHAFNSISWALRGRLVEHSLDGQSRNVYRPSWRPIITKRETFHRVVSVGTSWVFTVRGPWSKTWAEWEHGKWTQFHWGRKVYD